MKRRRATAPDCAVGGPTQSELRAEVASLTQSLADRSAQAARLTQQLAALQAELTLRDVRDQVDEAIKAGRLLPVMRDWALMLGAVDPERLNEFCVDPSLRPAMKGAAHE